MLKKVFIFFIALFLLLSSNVFPNNTGPIFSLQTYDNSSGLSNSSINDIITDNEEKLWLATWDGLNMYDGKNFHVFNYNKENDLRSIGNNVIQSLKEDANGNIWMTTVEGVSMYEKSSGKIFNFFYKNSPAGNTGEHEYMLTKDMAGSVYCITQRGEIWKFENSQKKFILFSSLPSNNKITKAAFCNNNRLLLLRNNGSLEIFKFEEKKLILSHILSQKIRTFFSANNKILLAGHDNSLYSLNKDKVMPTFITRTIQPVQSIVYYNGHYLLSWKEAGFSTFDEQFKPVTFMQEVSTRMKNIKIACWSAGNNNILWVGTDGNGIIKISLRTKNFGSVTNISYGAMYNQPVRAFCKFGNTLWVGTKGGGILSFDISGENDAPSKKQNYTYPAHLDNNSVYVLQRTSGNFIVIGSDGRGFSLFDIAKNRFYKWHEISGTDKCPEFASVYAVLEDHDSSLWIGTSGYGLLHLKVSKNKNGAPIVQFIEKFTSGNYDNGPANDIIYTLSGGIGDHLWIGCRYGGLSLLNKATKKFKTLKAFVYDGSLSNNDVLSVYKDNRNILWVGTSYGLNWIKESEALKEKPFFNKITTTQGLPNNTIHGIVQDNNGKIWVSTSRGLATIELNTNKIVSYQQADGLQNNEFSDGAAWKDAGGQLFFGGISGFNHFFPGNIKTTESLPNLFLSNISVGGKPERVNTFDVFTSYSPSQPLKFFIDRKNNFFEMNIGAINYLNADKGEFAYYLEGYDNQWNNGNSNKIAYSHIMPGNYTLKIKWSNGEGFWSSEVPVLQLKVNQYPWLTWWAISFYLLIITGIGYWYITYRKNKIKIEQKLAMEHLMRTKEEEIHQNRISFFTNIAHELQTPLTLITGGIERFLDKAGVSKAYKEKNQYLFVINQQAAKLAYLLQQLFEFRKIEAGIQSNQYTFIDVSKLLQQLAEPFIALSEHNNIHYQYNILPDIRGFVDKDKIEKIIFNLLSNAFKYSDSGTDINFKAFQKNETLFISVTNSGVELQPAQLKKLFETFYTTGNNTDRNHFGTGIGLAFTRQLVHLLKGTITATNDDGLMTFEVQLPIGLPDSNTIVTEKTTEKPSYLYKVITAQHERAAPQNSVQRNKEAIITAQHEKEKESILIVDDENDIRELLRDIFKEDYIIYEAGDGKEALSLVNKTAPSLIISDVMMPNVDGLSFCERIKNAPATCHLPVILLSAKSAEDQHMEGYEAGADAYISKPFLTQHLKLRVRKLLQYRQKLQQLQKDSNLLNLDKNDEIQDNDKTFLTDVYHLIDENIINPDLNAALLEKSLCLSKMQLYRKLKTLSGMSPNEFIKNVRLQKAASMLTSSQKTVADIFYSTGFNNQSYFFREFKKKYGCSPAEYRENQMPGIRQK